MQAVPSLVGTGTAVAAAAAGLVFGQPSSESEIPWSSPPNQTVFPSDYDAFRIQSSSARPSTSAAALMNRCPSPVEDFPYASFRQVIDDSSGSISPAATDSSRPPRPATGVQSPKSSSRRHSFLRQGDVASRPIAENARDSASSRESWIRRLSLRPLSQHGSSRSSMGPDSSSMTFSNASGVPMLCNHAPAQATPNKLVKRSELRGHHRRGSKSQVLTLRRPATSHQRSATLQQSQPQGGVADPPPSAGTGAKFSFEQFNLPGVFTPTSPTFKSWRQVPGKLASFFHIRKTTSLGPEASSGGQSVNRTLFPKSRISLSHGPFSPPYLTKTDCITELPATVDHVEPSTQQAARGHVRGNSQESSNLSESTDSTPDPRTRRSMSVHLNSAGNWLTRTSSFRRPRRSTIESKGGVAGGRYPPELVGVSRDAAQSPVEQLEEEDYVPSNYLQETLQQTDRVPQISDPPRSRKRNSTSPLPPLTRLSSFNIDVARLGSSTSSSVAQARPFHVPINYMSHSNSPPAPSSRGPSGERSITLAGSDFEMRDGMYGDDDDTDFRSDAYDSFRTVASSSRVRSVETPLESMFDESPPSTASNGRTKRLSIQEILGRPWDGETKITEEDETNATPIRAVRLAGAAEFKSHDENDDDFTLAAKVALRLADSEYAARISFDDDEDDDWARDDDNTLSNHLSPPSSTNSRRVSPTLRHALMNLGSNTNPDPPRESVSDRPRSSIFDWSEPSIHDKHDSDFQRPKTVHGKQELDLRIGRSTSRKTPGAAHVRSQSVPLVPDPVDGSKPPQKFGTWGIGTKNVSEDWDDDFDFDEEVAINPVAGKDSATSFSMIVPASIQATQPSVKAHSGQIRELSLLVNDLKRLCRHGKELDILYGPAAAKWVEAENIIALASPDEDDTDEFGTSTRPSVEFDRSKMDERFVEEGFDGSLLDHIDDPFEIPEPEMTRTTVVRQRSGNRRRSVFSPDDDIFGNNWPLADDNTRLSRPRTPDPSASPSRDSAVNAVIEAMQQQRATSLDSVKKTTKSVTAPDTKLFFDTNSLQELVKRAGHLRDSLSDAVRRAELLTQSPAGTPIRGYHHHSHSRSHSRHNNLDGSPAFTRVFTDPATSSAGSTPPPPHQRRLPKSHSTNSVLSSNGAASRGSADSSAGAAGGVTTRMQQMMIVG
ncbi:hypothetical protein QBC38DRAFT_438944 [Podospora fimiseda]|uniref:Uncharacterized protein n=1 Tax=Podospora fimiseda TaxID=252190 RepID=A0AAN7C092_9PEZI|nr:hypothetical protein QBC38DRAFT_438944 [Podospora fimiseda]